MFAPALRVEVADGHVFGALDLVVNARHREAAFFAHLQPVAFDQFRIDQNQQLIACLRNVDDDDAQMHIDLRRRQPDARCLVHRLGHVGRQRRMLSSNFSTAFCDFFQARIGIAEDGQ
jgi:hypothetical protein